MMAASKDVIEIDSSDDDDDYDYFDDDTDANDATDQHHVSSTSSAFIGQGSMGSSVPNFDGTPRNDSILSSSQSSMNTLGPIAGNGLTGWQSVLPSSLMNHKQVENTTENSAGGNAGKPSPRTVEAPRNGNVVSSGNNNSFGKRAAQFTTDESSNKRRILPSSLINDRTGKSTSSQLQAVTQHHMPSYGNDSLRNTQESKIGESFMKPKLPSVAMGNFKGETSSVSPNPFIAVGDGNIAYGNSSSYRVLPTTVASSSKMPMANNIEMQPRPMMDDRNMTYDESVIYQEALQQLSQPKSEDDLPDGMLSVSLLKHQKIALSWMVQKENSSHCAGGILADDQGLGKTISMIALIQKLRFEQDKFMLVDTNRPKSEALNLDEDDEGVTVLDKRNQDDKIEHKIEPKVLDKSNQALKIEPNNEMKILDRSNQAVKTEPKNEPKVSTSSHVSCRTRPAAGTLVVCPASVLKQWANELTDKVTERAKLSVLVYHGGARTRSPTDLTKYDVVITTYTIVTNEVPKQSPFADDDEQKNDKYSVNSEFSSNNKRKAPSNGNGKAKKKAKRAKDSDFDNDAGPLARVRWFRVVLDEAQTIKNHRTQVARACSGLRAKRRWCLTGTPIQNTIDDLYSYFRFLKYDPLSVYSTFCLAIKHPISRDANHGYKKLQAVLRTVLLRRTKDTLIDGEPIIKLPPKNICLKTVDFTSEERQFYLRLEERSRQQFKAYAAAGTVKQNYANILLLLLRLRQACDHPFLVRGCQSGFVGNDSIEIAKQLPREMVVNLLSKLEGSSAICSICSDPPEDAVVAMCGHVFCYPCIHEQLTSDENMCPVSGCKDILGMDSIFSERALKYCIIDKSDSNGASSSSTSEEESSISQSSYISTKIHAAVEILNSIICLDTVNEPNSKTPVKAIVFSQWTSMLDLVELSLNENLIQFRRLDGTMTLVARDRAVKEFNTDPEVRVMLMSLKAGNLGLNMVAACHVILLDLWWNPYAEDQAVDRAHRIGQTRTVTVSRITVQETVEDRILALQEEKRKMVNHAFGEDKKGAHSARLTIEDLRYLFRV